MTTHGEPSRTTRTARFERFLATGSEEAFAGFLAVTTPILLRFAYPRAQSLDDAEDLVQATYLTALRKTSSFVRGSDPLPWMIGILVTHSRWRWRQLQRRAGRQDAAPAGEPSPDTTAVQREIAAELEQAVARLSAPYQEVVARFVRDDETPRAIANALGRSRSTVRSQLARGLAQLRDLLPRGLATGALASLALQARVDALHARIREGLPAGPGPDPATAPLRRRPRVRLAHAAAPLLLAAIVFVAWLVAPGSDSRPSAVNPANPVAADASAPVAAGTALAAATRTAPAADTTKPASRPAGHALQRVRIVDARSGEPIPGVRLQLFPRDGPKRPILEYYESRLALAATTDEAGVATFPGPIAYSLAAVVFDDGSRSGAPFRIDAEAIHEEPVQRVLELTGMVRSPDGAPVAAASLMLSSNMVVAGGIEVASTDASGAYLAHLVNLDGTFYLWAEAEGFAPSPVLTTSVAVGAGTHSLTLGAGTPLLGVVCDGEQRPVPDALVRLLPIGAQRTRWPPQMLRTAPGGTFQVLAAPDRPLAVVARAPGVGSAYAIVEPDAPRQLSLVLRPGGRVAGRATDARGNAVGGRVIVAPKFVGPERALLGTFARSCDLVDGEFAVDSLGAGAIWASVQQDGQTVHVEELFVAPGTTVGWHPVVLDDDTIDGHLLDPKGSPLPGIKVALVAEDGVRSATGWRHAVTGPAGAFRFCLCRSERHRLHVLGGDNAQPTPDWTSFAVRRGDRALRLVLPPAATPTAGLELTLVDPHGQPTGGQIILREATSTRTVRTVIGRNGRLALDSLPGGSFELMFGQGRAPASYSRRLGRIELVPGQVLRLGDVALEKPAVVTVELVRAGAKVARPSMEVVRAGTPFLAASEMDTADPVDGRFHLDAGRWKLWAAGEDHAPVQVEFDVVAGEERTLVLPVEPAPSCVLEFDVDHKLDMSVAGTLELTIADETGADVVHSWARTETNPVRTRFGLPPGRYVVRAVTAWQARGEARFVVPTAPAAPITVRVQLE